MTQGNLSSHLQKLESAGYVKSEKKFRGKRPLTLISITVRGKDAFRSYVKEMHHYFSDLSDLVD